MSLVLENGQPGRRTGLSKKIGSSLLRTFNASVSQNQAAMRPRAVAKGQTAGVKPEAVAKKDVEEEEDYLRPPDSDHESDEDFYKKSNEDIQSTDFRSASEKPEEQQEKDIVIGRGGKKGTAIAKGKAPTNTRSRRGKISPASNQSNDSPKRKSQEELKPLGAGMVDAHGRPKVNKKPRTSTYGSKKTFQKPPKIESDVDEDSPKKAFKKVPTIESPEKSAVEEGSGLRRPNRSVDGSPATTPSSGTKFRRAVLTQSPDKEESIQQPVFKKPGISFDDSLEESNLDDSQPSLPGKMQKTIVEEDSPATQRPGFKAYIFDDDNLVGKAQSILRTESSQRPLASAPLPDDDDDEDFPTMTQMAKCPMCGESVHPAELRAYGRMNTRKQEKFCRSHRRTTALKIWDEEEYPTIDWDKLDSRISKHHSFIKELINGADSHYRDRLAETVNAGKNRSLLKSDYNPTPGYYGTRGLRAISENTMRKFTPLLKKRMVVDRLMAARGFTPYVEYVVVPEVAVKLIMEDMKCGAERAREIMSESLGVGELLSEEIRDIVARRGSEGIEDSDE